MTPKQKKPTPAAKKSSTPSKRKIIEDDDDEAAILKELDASDQDGDDDFKEDNMDVDEDDSVSSGLASEEADDGTVARSFSLASLLIPNRYFQTYQSSD